MLATAEQEVAALQSRFRSDTQSRLREAVVDSESGLSHLLWYHLGWEAADGTPSNVETGKGLRPVLCLTACELAGGDWHKALPAAAALELIHNFSLIHDDIQDGDATRWGRPTLWSVRGVAPAIWAGNAMRVVADQTLAALTGSGLAPRMVAGACAEMNQRYLEMIEGQYLDVAFEDADDVTTADYLDMVGRKTGALIEAAMHLGALVATSDEKTAFRFGQCGRKLGVAFQARDDYLGVWGDPSATGKAVGADIRRKKKSLPIVHMFHEAGKADREWLDNAYAEDEVSGRDVEYVLEILDRISAAEYVQEVAESQSAGALAAVEELDLEPEALRKLEALAEFFVTRRK